jgi:hypothetical protein
MLLMEWQPLGLLWMPASQQATAPRCPRRVHCLQQHGAWRALGSVALHCALRFAQRVPTVLRC